MSTLKTLARSFRKHSIGMATAIATAAGSFQGAYAAPTALTPSAPHSMDSADLHLAFLGRESFGSTSLSQSAGTSAFSRVAHQVCSITLRPINSSVINAYNTEADQTLARMLGTAGQSISREDIAALNITYNNLDLFFLSYPNKLGASDFSTTYPMCVYALYLAENYGLKTSREFRDFVDAVRDANEVGFVHHEGTRRTETLGANGNNKYLGLKYEAVTQIHATAARFLERAERQYSRQRNTRGEARPTTKNAYRIFGRFCSLLQQQGQAVQEVYASIENSAGRRPATNMVATDGAGRLLRCPAPDQIGRYPGTATVK